MLLRLRLLLGSLVGAGALLALLCLGAQNLEERPRLNLLVGRTAPLPSGFVVGVAFVLGVVGGGAGALLLFPGAGRAPQGEEW